MRGESSAQEKKALDRTRREEMHHSSEVHRMVRLQKSLLALLRIVLVLFAATLARTVSAETDDVKPAAGSPGTSVAAADTTQGSSSSDGKDDSSDDDDDDDDGEEQQ